MRRPPLGTAPLIVLLPQGSPARGVLRRLRLDDVATYTCQGETATFRFRALTIGLERV
jgi:hypothetical protein